MEITKEQDLFTKIGHDIPGAIQSQMFGKPCFKTGGKAFICFFQNEMVFKLSGNPYHEAMQLSGAKLFDPSGKLRPMKGWVQIPASHCALWSEFANEANSFVSQMLHE